MRSKAEPAVRDFDVLIYGSHPTAYVAKLLLDAAGMSTLHITGPSPDDRLVLVNPAIRGLDKALKKLPLDGQGVTGTLFLQGDGPSSSRAEGDGNDVSVIMSLATLREELAALSKPDFKEATFSIESTDEEGVNLELSGRKAHARAVILTDPPEVVMTRALSAEPAPMSHRMTLATVPLEHLKTGAGPLAVSPQLFGEMVQGRLLVGSDVAQIDVTQPLSTLRSHPSADVLAQFAEALVRHGQLDDVVSLKNAGSLDVPLEQALRHETVGDRTLLLGPAGGFLSGMGEDVYPGCWSATFAAEVLPRALDAEHPQDALQAFRSAWGTSLGAYLGGPQQNLKFLLPLVWQNPVMTQRLSDALLRGKSLVR